MNVVSVEKFYKNLKMKYNEEIFEKIALKINKEFNHEQFAKNNWQLYLIIIKSMDECQKPLKEEIRKLKKIVDDDTDFKAMRNYAKELERKLEIDPNAHK